MTLSNLGKAITLASTLAVSGAALAASDGTLGATSTGTSDVTVEIADRVQISRLDDIALGTYGGTGAVTGSDFFCVYRNGTGLYDLTVTSANEDAGAFRVSDGTNFITYTVAVDDDLDLSDALATASSGTQVGLAGNTAATDCGASDNAGIQVSFDEAVLQAAPTGVYSDTITLLVEPS